MTIQEIRRKNLIALLKAFDTDKEFCSKSGIETGYLSQLKMGGKPIGNGRNIGEKVARRIEESLGLPPGNLDKDSQDMVKETGSSYEINNVDTAKTYDNNLVPVISWVQAGDWHEAIDLDAVNVAEDWVPRVNGGERVYALVVRGESMIAPQGISPTFPSGTIIQVDPDQSADEGSYVIAKINGHAEVTFKQLKHEDGRPYLKPLNSDFKPIFEEFKVIGKVIGFSGKL